MAGQAGGRMTTLRYGDNQSEISMEDVISAAKKANIHSFVAALPQGYETTVRRWRM